MEQKDKHKKKLQSKLPVTILNNVLYIQKRDKPYIGAAISDALKIEDEIKNENDNFLDTAIDLKVDISTANQKMHDFYLELFDTVVDLPSEK